MPSSIRHAASAAAVLSLLAMTAHAAVSLRSTLSPQAGNHNPGGGSISVASLTGGFFLATDNSIIAETEQFSFSGLNASGNPQTMTYEFDGAVRSDFGSLRARFRSSLDNKYYNPTNTRWIDDPTNGSPSFFSGQSFASFTDDITIAASGQAASVSFVVRVTGEISAVPAGGFGQVALWRVFDGGSSGFRSFNNSEGAGPLVLDELVTTPSFTVVDGVASVGLGLQTWVTMDLRDAGFADGSDATVQSDAFNTLRIVDIIVRDASGAVLDTSSVVGQSGLDYLAFIPTPGSGALLAIGAALGATRRRRA